MIVELTDIEKKEDRDRMSRTTTSENEYHAPEFVEHVVRRWMPYFIFWSAIDLDLLDANPSRLSNAYVESYNRVLKESVLNNRTQTSLADCVRKLNTKQQTTIAEINLNAVPVKGTKKSRSKKKYLQAEDDRTAEESWQKKGKRARSDGYVRGNLLSRSGSKANAEKKGSIAKENENANDEKILHQELELNGTEETKKKMEE